MTQGDALGWISELFEEKVENLTPDTHRDDISAWDSLGVLTLIASLDSDLGIVLKDTDIQQIHTVGDILALMRREGKLT